MAKLKPAIKGQITKLFKQGKELQEIREIIKEKSQKITTEKIKTVLRAHFIKLCDDLWRELVFLQDGNRCIIEKTPDNLNPHHLIGRGNYKYRWNQKNGVTLGVYRHTMAHDMAAHGSTSATQAFADWMKTNRKIQWEWFQVHREDPRKIKVDVYYLLDTAKRLKFEIETLRNQPKPDILARKKV
jgi:hypothetical protein